MKMDLCIATSLKKELGHETNDQKKKRTWSWKSKNHRKCWLGCGNNLSLSFCHFHKFDFWHHDLVIILQWQMCGSRVGCLVWNDTSNKSFISSLLLLQNWCKEVNSGALRSPPSLSWTRWLLKSYMVEISKGYSR